MRILPPPSGSRFEGLGAVKAPSPLEKDVQRSVLLYLEALRIYAAHAPNGSVLAGDAKARAIQSNALKKAGVKPGFPDLILIKRDTEGSRVGFFEIKRESGKLSPEQEAFSDLCTDWRLPFAVVRSVGDAQTALTQWGWL